LHDYTTKIRPPNYFNPEALIFNDCVPSLNDTPQKLNDELLSLIFELPRFNDELLNLKNVARNLNVELPSLIVRLPSFKVELPSII
jgi:hypothetical protein